MSHELTPLAPAALESVSPFPRFAADLADYYATWEDYKRQHAHHDENGELTSLPPAGYREFAGTQINTQAYDFFYMKYANYQQFGIDVRHVHNLHHRGKTYAGQVAPFAPDEQADLAQRVSEYQYEAIRRDGPSHHDRHPTYTYLSHVLNGWVHHPDDAQSGRSTVERIEALHSIIPEDKRTAFTIAGFMTGRLVTVLHSLEVFGAPTVNPAPMGPSKSEIREWERYESSRNEGYQPFTLPDMLGMIAMENGRCFQLFQPDRLLTHQVEADPRTLPPSA